MNGSHPPRDAIHHRVFEDILRPVTTHTRNRLRLTDETVVLPDVIDPRRGDVLLIERQPSWIHKLMHTEPPDAELVCVRGVGRHPEIYSADEVFVNISRGWGESPRSEWPIGSRVTVIGRAVSILT